MPLDCLSFGPRLDHEPSLERLAYVLRHRDAWPKGFRWNYRRTATCAVGLAMRHWALPHEEMFYDRIRWMMQTFDMPKRRVVSIFFDEHATSWSWHRPFSFGVSPETVAEAIKHYVRTRELAHAA